MSLVATAALRRRALAIRRGASAGDPTPDQAASNGTKSRSPEREKGVASPSQLAQSGRHPEGEPTVYSQMVDAEGPVWLPEAFPTRIRATAVSFCFNAPRLIAFVGPLVAGTLITAFGNNGRAAIIVSTIYLVGIVAAPFFPETRGRPLPD